MIGAFALTQNLFLIAIGLGIRAMYVRAMTVMLVERGTLTRFRYLENGAFWSILILSLLMFAQTLRRSRKWSPGFWARASLAWLSELADMAAPRNGDAAD